jgi:hypothetical protein
MQKTPPMSSSIFRERICQFKIVPPQSIPVIAIAQQCGIRRRRLYEFGSLLPYFGVCVQVNRCVLA